MSNAFSGQWCHSAVKHSSLLAAAVTVSPLQSFYAAGASGAANLILRTGGGVKIKKKKERERRGRA